MDPEDRKLLEEMREFARENNKILRGIRRSNRWGAFFHVVYWIIIIGISVGAFYYLQPYITTLENTYQGIQKDISGVQSIANKLPFVSNASSSAK